MMLVLLQVLALCFFPRCSGDNSTQIEFDPYLQYRPPFARSLPIQILLTGVVLTLVAVLFIHLIFTAQYHWPLAPVNYVLQLSGVTTLLISLIATLHVVLSATIAESLKWPYMLSYIAVNVPPLGLEDGTETWSVAERATWLVMNASTSGLIQITHIQFLTLLYPSRLEGRLIFTLLGPMAIVAAVMQLLPINGSPQVNEVASAVRNVCNATLSLLFTASLFIWGLLVNRKQAWRTDGGTAAFGCAALVLALVSTALNFLYVPREEEYVWLPGLMWAVVLWQSFLGWWWWVGAGSGGGREDELEEKLRREAKRESRRRNAQGKRQETRDKAKKVWQGVANAFGTREGSQIIRRRRSSRSISDPDASIHPVNSDTLTSQSDIPESTVSTTSSAGTLSTLPHILPAIVHRWYASLRHAHLSAARQQTAERIERFKELDRGGIKAQTRGVGWGLGSFAWRAGREEAVRLEANSASAIGTSQPSRRGSRGRRRTPKTSPASSSPDEVHHSDDHESNNEREGPAPIPPIPPPPVIPVERPQSMWWWGPLRRWRLQDSTVY